MDIYNLNIIFLMNLVSSNFFKDNSLFFWSKKDYFFLFFWSNITFSFGRRKKITFFCQQKKGWQLIFKHILTTISIYTNS